MFCIVVFLILGMFFEAIGIKAGYEAQISQIYRNFSREVDFRRVTMKGQNNFRAQIEIIYKDGELDRIILVPKTTVPVEAKVEESKDKESEIKK
ncbi:MAG TPA: hypothetical protein PLK35_03795 [Candidatus Moranbacteria bacterium]|nr:hypothetical protein [Candidatus Moranbacteria bacterium]